MITKTSSSFFFFFCQQNLLQSHAEQRRILRQLNTALEYLSEEAEDLYEQQLQQDLFDSENTKSDSEEKENKQTNILLDKENLSSKDRRETLLELRKKGEKI